MNMFLRGMELNCMVNKRKNSILSSKLIKNKLIRNMLIIIGFIIYFGFIVMGYKTLKSDVLRIDLYVFAFTNIMVAIVIFERAYAKNKGIIAIYGIEVLLIGLFILYLPTYYFETSQEIRIDYIFSGVFIIYYIIKTIIEKKKEKKVLKDD
jgi:hypothetical protein